MTKTILRYLLLLSSALLLPHGIEAQIKQSTFTGKVVDQSSLKPIPYATVVAKEEDGKVLNGTTTLADGYFELEATGDGYYLEIAFIGYEKIQLRDFEKASEVDLGTIKLSENTQTLDAVEIRAEKSVTEFKLDKRVFNVGKDISSTGMGALDVLNNVPSVRVDIEGQVSLRGNAGVQILINGKPSVLADTESNALGSITADMIESIEVITNPSAKYEAEGTSGIINIILKKDERQGLNGSVSVNTGIPDNHSIGLSLNRRTEHFNFFTQLGVGYRSLPRYTENINRNTLTGTAILSEGTEFRNENFYNITLGTDYHINELNVLTLSGSFAYEVEEQPSETNFSRLDSNGSIESTWLREETTSALNPKYDFDLQYKKEFRNNEEHVLLFSAIGTFFGKDLSSDFVNTTLSGDNVDALQKTETSFLEAGYTFKLDYTNPISEAFTIETGAQYELNDVSNVYAVFTEEAGSFVPDSNLTNDFRFDQAVLGAYATGAYEGDKWGIKAGLRIESTNLKTLLATTGERGNQNYTNFFPSLHSSYKFSKRFSMQAGYSRRIFRPRLWHLNPFFNIRNNFNIRQGNPLLQPEFTDSYELTGIFLFAKISLSTGLYHLFTTENIERISTVVDNVNITMPMNIGSRASTGLELNAKYSPLAWLNLSTDINLMTFSREGQFENQSFDFNGSQWTGRLTSKFKLPKDFDIELNGNYESSFETVQGDVSGFAYLDFGIRKKLWKGKTIVSLGIRDVFASRIRETIRTQGDFYLYSFGQRGRFITLGLSYGFGKGEAMTYSGRRR
jgi:outer membrane receptor for ferrienterochelin and colicin